MGFAGVRELRRPHGFDASDRETGRYGTLFGRDSLWILLILLEVTRLRRSSALADWVEAAGSAVLSALCQYQGTKLDDEIEEQPGKIVHEVREQLDERLVGMDFPFHGGRSYIGFDETFLFIVAASQFFERFPASTVRDKVWPGVERALDWVKQYGDEDGDGLFEYRRRDPRNPLNQVWKDSYDSAVQTGFNVPPAPLAWIEVQGFAYRAFLDAAAVLTTLGQRDRSDAYTGRAQALKHKVNEQFWMTGENCLAMALDGTKRKITMVTSNAGQALWADVVDAAHTDALVHRLMQPDLFSRYGIRTLSSESEFYAPFTYHRGNIWPYDNAVLAMGLRRHGYHAEARTVMEAVAAAIAKFGSPVELYIALEAGLIIDPPLARGEALSYRRLPPENRNQGWTAAALMYFAAALSDMSGHPLPDA